jgi:predicted amidohydrolase
LAYNEVEDGLTQEITIPSFQTDFGKVGMMICYDSEFPDPARAVGVAGGRDHPAAHLGR